MRIILLAAMMAMVPAVCFGQNPGGVDLTAVARESAAAARHSLPTLAELAKGDNAARMGFAAPGDAERSELAAPFGMALPSLMQHLRVLENAGVVTSEKHGRVRTVSLRPGALDVLHLWLGEQRTPAEHHADRLGIHLTLTNPKEV